MTILDLEKIYLALGELNKDRLNFGVISSRGTPLAQVARCARKHEVARIRHSAAGRGQQMVNVEYAPIRIEELENAPLGNLGSGGPEPAVSAGPLVSLSDEVSHASGDVSRVAHASRLALRIALRPARAVLRPTVTTLQASAHLLVERMIEAV